MPRKSFARFSPLARGRIVGKAEEGAPRSRIRKEVLKKDGKRAKLRAIDAVIARIRADPNWDGRDSSAGGRPRALNSQFPP